MSTVIGTLSERRAVELAIDTLVANGFSRDSFGVLWRDKDASSTENVPTNGATGDSSSVAAEAGKGVAGGAVGGAAAGAGTVLLTSAGLALIPGIGALLAAGTAAAAAVAATAGAVGGGVAGGVLGVLLGSSDNAVNESLASDRAYRSVLDREGFVLTVTTAPEDAGFAADVLEKIGGEDVAIFHEASASA